MAMMPYFGMFGHKSFDDIELLLAFRRQIGLTSYDILRTRRSKAELPPSNWHHYPIARLILARTLSK